MSQDNQDNFHWPLLGNSPVKQLLQSAVSHDSVAHAYLFVGPSRVGKSTMASLLAASLVCQQKKSKRPCQHCPACDQMSRGIHPDVDRITPNEHNTISITDIRALQHKLSLRSFLTEYKIAIIDHIDSLTEEAANALLKTLEEPTPKTVFILTAENRSSIPSTILSRCQILQFNLVPTFQITNWLISRGCERRLASHIAHIANGRPGLAINLMENPALVEERSEQIKKLSSLFKASYSDKLAFIGEITGSKQSENDVQSLNTLLDVWAAYFRDILFKKVGVTLAQDHSSVAQLPAQFSSGSAKKISLILSHIYRTKGLLQQSVNPRLAMENLIMDIA